MSVEQLLAQGGKLFDSRGNLLTMWQEIAENFYPERADFTVTRNVGQELMHNLATGHPVLVRRDLANSIGGMLRPTNKPWFHARTDGWDELDDSSRAWLERAEERQRKAMYHRATQFTRATKEADNDFVTFGNFVMQVSRNSRADGLLFRTWHLRDCAWCENQDGEVDTLYRKWKTSAINLVRLFPRSVHQEVRRCVEEGRDQYKEIDVWHCVVPVDGYKFQNPGMKPRPGMRYVSVYIDVQNKHIMEEVPMDTFEYIVGRWQTVSGSQYAYSPAVVVALADARTLQEMTFTLLDAGEKSVTPPLLGVQGALRSDINVMAGGVTWVDREYDERLGEVLRPLTIDKSGIPLGMDMAQGIQSMLIEAFYLNKISLPPQDVQMTAFETGQRVQEYIRHALPLFEPMEYEYNAPVCENTFEILLRAGVFGTPFEIPQPLRGREVMFLFESPLHDAIEKEKTQKYLEGTSLVANAAAVDPAAVHILNIRKGTRGALRSTGVPSEWLRSEDEVNQIVQQESENAQANMLLEQMQKGAEVAKTIGTTPVPSGTGGGGQATSI